MSSHLLGQFASGNGWCSQSSSSTCDEQMYYQNLRYYGKEIHNLYISCLHAISILTMMGLSTFEGRMRQVGLI